MTDKLLQFSSWLGVRCEATEGDNVWHDNDCSKILSSCCPTAATTTKQNSVIVTFPSFSLDHTTHLERNKSKEEVQKEASSLLSSRISVDVLEEEEKSGGQIPRIILSNLYSSFDKLVDARILAFSKILHGHGRTLVQSSGTTENEEEDEEAGAARVLQFKLQTLLEVGTSISADSVTTTVLPTATNDIKMKKEEDGSIVIPMSLQVTIDNLHLTCTASGDTAVLPAVIFEAPGTIKGTFNKQNLDILETVDVDVDCKILLNGMIAQASEVVAKIVDMTNTAWEKTQHPDESMPPPPSQKKSLPDPIKKSQQHVVSPDLYSVSVSKKRPLPLIPLDLDVHDDDETGCYLHMNVNKNQDDREGSIDRNLSAEDASAIVDYVICQVDTDTIAPQAYKRQRTTASN